MKNLLPIVALLAVLAAGCGRHSNTDKSEASATVLLLKMPSWGEETAVVSDRDFKSREKSILADMSASTQIICLKEGDDPQKHHITIHHKMPAKDNASSSISIDATFPLVSNRWFLMGGLESPEGQPVVIAIRLKY